MCPSRLVDAATVARQILGVSLSHFFSSRKRGRFGPQPVRLGRAVRFDCQEIEAWIAAGTPNAEQWKRIWQAQKAR